ncbi:MAG: hypothetical protein K1X57_07055 [Gemmataceae bacterium]|nr:hypothetical protein [Gemmataceae bacterium]
MAACIEIVRGPDAGWKYRMTGGDVRIGRGAGHAIRIPDPAWPTGSLHIQHRQGGYVVTNHLPHPVYLDERPLAPEQQQTWYAGGLLQPTASTLLRLVVSEGEAESSTASGPVVAEGPTVKRSSIALNAVLAGLILLGLPLVWWAMQPGPKVDPVARMHRAVVALDQAIAGHPADSPQYRLVKILREAVLAESQRDSATAYALYEQARQQVRLARTGGGIVDQFWDQLTNEIARRCQVLAPPARRQE